MKTKFPISGLLAATVLLAFSAPAFADTMDARIESAAKQSYIFKIYLKGDDIKIQSNEGAVTLTGTVSENSHKSLAQDTVADLPGVKSVYNNLEVTDEEHDKSSDAWLVAKIKTSLLFYQNVSTTTKVDAKDGIVTLSGDAASQAQKELTTEYVKDVDGVKNVINEMTVNNKSEKKQTVGEKIDDASITAQVKMTLLYHRSTSALNTTVTTKDGVVTLGGKAENEAEIKLAAKLANNVNGVKSVQNRMSVE